jgi:hypothetical protein
MLLTPSLEDTRQQNFGLLKSCIYKKCKAELYSVYRLRFACMCIVHVHDMRAGFGADAVEALHHFCPIFNLT